MWFVYSLHLMNFSCSYIQVQAKAKTEELKNRFPLTYHSSGDPPLILKAKINFDVQAKSTCLIKFLSQLVLSNC